MLKHKLKDYHVILASKSPRRQKFLKDLGIDFTIQTKEVEEIYPNYLVESEITEFLADLKSKAFTNLKENDLLITSDTIVWLKNKALGKPKDSKEAFKMLRSLSGKEHKVITSISIKSKNFQKIVSDITTVSFKEISDDEIDYYITNYKPFDKAGAYGIQEWIGFTAIKSIKGSYFNVVGLPVYKLYNELIKL